MAQKFSKKCVEVLRTPLGPRETLYDIRIARIAPIASALDQFNHPFSRAVSKAALEWRGGELTWGRTSQSDAILVSAAELMTGRGRAVKTTEDAVGFLSITVAPLTAAGAPWRIAEIVQRRIDIMIGLVVGDLKLSRRLTLSQKGSRAAKPPCSSNCVRTTRAYRRFCHGHFLGSTDIDSYSLNSGGRESVSGIASGLSDKAIV
jgi:hypothetical protein